MFLPREKKHRYYVDHRENLFYIRTNKAGRNFAIMTAPESDPAPKNWKVFIPQRDDVLIAGIWTCFRISRSSVERSQRARPPARV